MFSLILVAMFQLLSTTAAQTAEKAPAPSSVAQPQGTPSPNLDMVLRWNELALEAIRKEETPPPVAARNLAIVHISIFDAVNSITNTNKPYRVYIKPLPGASLEAAAAGAGHRTLVALYPRLRNTFDQALAQSLAQLPDGNGKIFGRDLGGFVADRILAGRIRDGMDRQTTYAPREGPGIWQRTPPDFAAPLLPHWSGLTPFAMDGRIQLHPKDPPRLTDAVYTTAFKEVKELGGANSKARTKDQTEISYFWADNAGTSTPPGHWNQIAQTVAKQRGTSLVENARLFSILNIALADTGIMCWDCKYKLGFWRPVTGIHNADKTGNRETEADRTWTPLLTTPPFPSYTSGHSSFSGAAATVLTEFFGDNVRFEATSEGLPGVTRSFNSFWAAAEEAGQSRIYGGIHWQFDNTEGLAMGKTLGQFVSRNYLLARN
ncbi:MAG TPA: phosphatase PAP2 family protein [Gemmataceae bacterium]|nr:phosphatase PAP2 family protein [Gemmataceae bacterium]